MDYKDIFKAIKDVVEESGDVIVESIMTYDSEKVLVSVKPNKKSRIGDILLMNVRTGDVSSYNPSMDMENYSKAVKNHQIVRY